MKNAKLTNEDATCENRKDPEESKCLDLNLNKLEWQKDLQQTSSQVLLFNTEFHK